MNIAKIFLRGGLAVCAAFLFMTGCAAKRPAFYKEPAPAAAAEEAKKSAGQLTLVSVVGLGNSVLVEADGLLQYTAFKLSDPPRVAIDMPGVGADMVQSSIPVDNNFITDIKTTVTGEGDNKIARVEVGLKSGVNYDVKAGEDSLLIDLSVETYISGVSAPEEIEEEVPAPEPPIEAAAPQGVDAGAPEPSAEPAPEPAPAEVIPDAKNIISVETSFERGVTVVRLTGDGQFGNYNSFGLDSPTRMVLDIWGVGASAIEKETSVSGPFIKGVRVGAHPDKTRLVFDSNPQKMPAYTIEKDGRALVVRFGADVEQIAAQQAVASKPYVPPYDAAEAAPVAPAYVPPAPEPELEPVTPEIAAVPEPAMAEVPEVPEALPVEGEAVDVTSVDFRKVNGNKGMLSIATSGKPAYKATESSDGLTVTLDIPNATIPDELKMTLDASGLNTVVSSISSFQPIDAENNVRVLVKLNEKASYTVKESNGTINVAFAASRAPARGTQAELVSAEEAATETPAKAARPTPLGAGAPPRAEIPVAKPLEDESSRPRYTGAKMDIDMIDAQVTDILKLIAEVSDKNIVATEEDVKGKITLRLKKIPWDQAFSLILKTKGLDSVMEGNVIRVASRDRLRKEKEEEIAAKRAGEKLEDLRTEYIRINYDKAATLESQIKKVLSDRGVITVHETTNTVIIKDVKSAIADAKDYIRKVDIPTPQVLIEARIVEADTSFARDLGVQWGVDMMGTTSSNAHAGMFGSTDAFGQQQFPISDSDDRFAGAGRVNGIPYKGDINSGPQMEETEGWTYLPGVTNYAVNLPAQGSAGALGAIGLALGKVGTNGAIVDLRISAGEQGGLVKIISKPRVVTLNNKEARITQGEKIPFETTSASGTQTEWIPAGLELKVSPQITPDGSVLLKIKVSRNSLGTFRTASGVPSVNTKEAETEVLVRNSETTVIGGVIVSDTSDIEKGIPFLKEIPVLGWLFKSKSISDIQRELLIFITPTIVEEEIAG